MPSLPIFRAQDIYMAGQTVRFIAVKTVQKPATVKFKTKSGETVSFKALKTVKKKEVVHFRAKRK
jgi:hypothetical protein